ncbi:MAG: DUF29 domain-containing protein [Lamprocystis purpurea]|jgi:hypothetical protein|uniref:DUF29 domain-containing protein n=1 Tax=Lamprocystis purpurea TaxID=61598 RepID=UPI00035D8669|nr:DUF29 domain-containing protein [Lamprocystis purpurea]MBV5272951.1 DUF29 domain-containing protein [Lamprocystis purpurea]
MSASLYDQDLYSWAMQTARQVREHRFAEIDCVHLAEELESMGKTELRALESRLVVLLAHLLIWEHQPGNRTKSRRWTLIEQRKRIGRLLDDSPSLRSKLPDLIADAYDSALRWAADETGMEEGDFPPACRYSIEQVMDTGFYPDTVIS